MKSGMRRGLSALALIGVVTLAVGGGALAAQRVPILAGPSNPYQKGYGHIKPNTIYNGGDESGVVKNIHWRSWGGWRAIGWGTGFYLKPHQFTYQGHFEKGAKIVLFHLGRCHGRRAYNAIEWFWPSHHQHFRPELYTNACTGFIHFPGH